MSAGSFSAALTALKDGQFVRRTNWRDEFLVLVGPHDVPTDVIEDKRLRDILAGCSQTQVHDYGNIRKFDMGDQSVVNGWVPTPEDLMSDGWATYDAAEVKLLRLEWELRDALDRRGDIARHSLVELLSEHLRVLEIENSAIHTVDSKFIDLVLLDHYEGVRIRVMDGGYELRGGPIYPAAGIGMLQMELQVALAQLGRHIVSQRTFHRTMITVEILSEDPIPDEMEMSEVIREMREGDYVGRYQPERSTKINGKQTADLLYEFASEPAFFRLDDEGRDLDE